MNSTISKKQTITYWIVFAVIFAALLVTATFTDLQVSRILTRGTLMPGEFLASGSFGIIFESIGCLTPYLLGAFALEIIAIYIIRFSKQKGRRTAGAAALIIASAVTYYFAVQDTLTYHMRHYRIEEKPAFLTGEVILIALFLTLVCTFAVNNFSDESIKGLSKASFALLFAILTATLFVTAVKEPFGRTRFRAMNYAGDFSYYTRWYVLNGQPDKEWMRQTFSSTDACRSFPSGHTQSAAMSFAIVMLGDAGAVRSKKGRAALWAGAVIWTALVALSRIMVGAHFFSDVLVGGTIGFLGVMAGREIFIFKGAHFKALKK